MKKYVNKGIAFVVAMMLIILFIGYALLQQNYQIPLLGEPKHVTISLFQWKTSFILQGKKPLNFQPLLQLQSQLFSAYMMTLVIVFWTSICSVIIGWVLFIGLRAKGGWLFVRYLFKAFHDFILAVPLIVFIIIFYYFIAPAYGMKDGFIIGVMMLSLYSGVYIYQVYEATIAGIPQSQFEGAKMLGMSTFETYRHIIIPQMLRNAMPPLVGQLSGIIKNSALLSYVAISEFTNVVNQIKANSFVIFESYIVLAIGYLVLTVPLIYLSSYIEKRLRGEQIGS